VLMFIVFGRAQCGKFRPLLLVTGTQGCGKTTLSLTLASRLCFHHAVVSANHHFLAYYDN